MRHPGAGRFARSSTVQINVLLFLQALDLVIEIIGFDADGPENPFGAAVIVSVAANVDNLNFLGFARRYAPGEFFHLYMRHDVVLAIFEKLRDAVKGIDQQGPDDEDFHDSASGVEA